MGTTPTKLTNKQAAAYLGISLMTIHLWRKGTASQAPMPEVEVEGRNVLHDLDKLRAWMRKSGVFPARELREVLRDPELQNAKTGPRPRRKRTRH